MSRKAICYIFFFIAFACAVPSSHPQPAQNAQPSNQDACLQSKDHSACLKYYRAGCIGKNPQSCGNYSREILTECPADTPPPNATLAQLQALLSCRRRAQCWQDRTIGLSQLADQCKNGTDSDQCKQAKTRYTEVTPAQCDKIGSGNAL